MQDFEKFSRARAPCLSRSALFEVIRHKFQKHWWEWPKQWRQTDDIQNRPNCAGYDDAEREFVD